MDIHLVPKGVGFAGEHQRYGGHVEALDEMHQTSRGTRSNGVREAPSRSTGARGSFGPAGGMVHGWLMSRWKLVSRKVIPAF